MDPSWVNGDPKKPTINPFIPTIAEGLWSHSRLLRGFWGRKRGWNQLAALVMGPRMYPKLKQNLCLDTKLAVKSKGISRRSDSGLGIIGYNDLGVKISWAPKIPLVPEGHLMDFFFYPGTFFLLCPGVWGLNHRPIVV